MRTILRAVAALVLGAGLVVFGLVEAASAEVDCGSSLMSPGDVCTEISGSSSTARTYDEQKADNQRTGYIMAGVGGVMLIAGAVMAAGAVRRRRGAAVS